MQKMAAIGIERNITMTKDLLIAPPKNALPGTLLRNSNLGIGQKI